MTSPARLHLLEHVIALLEELSREPADPGSVEQARRDDCVLSAQWLRNLVAELERDR